MKIKHAECYIKGYPRPQFVRKDFLLLDGDWDFCFDKENTGEKNGYFKSIKKERKIRVPYSYQSEASGINSEEYCECVWYQKAFDFSAKLQDKERAVLYLEGADYHTKVWINGSFAGENSGGYARFSFDITDLLINGKADIIIKCSDSYCCGQSRGKQKWEEKEYACFYKETTGIWKSVWAEFVGNCCIKSVKMIPDTSSRSIALEYEIDNFTSGIEVQAEITLKGKPVIKSVVSLYKNNYSHSLSLESPAHFDKVLFWNAHSAAIYDVKFTLFKNGAVLDEAGSYFGLAGYSVKNNYIMVNQHPEYLKMILDQGYFANGWYTADEDELLNDILICKELGLNGIRKHQKIEDERFYYYCDILGIYCWLEMPAMYEFNGNSAFNFLNEWERVVKQYQNHPSIMTWVPFNESWGVPSIRNSIPQQNLSIAAYYIAKTAVPNKFAIANDGWEHTITDIVTTHHYAADGKTLESLYGDPDLSLSDKRSKAPAYRQMFADGFKYEGQPVMLSEFGGVSYKTDISDGLFLYGDIETNEKEYYERLLSLFKTIRENLLFSGYCLTQLTDVQQEMNGILDIKRKPKISKEKLRSLFSI